MELQQFLTEARKVESLRQAYLDSFMPMCDPTVSAIVYDPDFSKRLDRVRELVGLGYESPDVLAKISRSEFDGNKFHVIGTPKMFGIREPQPIFVSEAAFTKYGVHNIWLNHILDHEVIHTSHLYDGIKIGDYLFTREQVGEIRRNTVRVVDEILAYKNMRDKMLERGLTREDYTTLIQFSFESEVSALREITAQTEEEERLIQEVLRIAH